MRILREEVSTDGSPVNAIYAMLDPMEENE
jgi:hypothetical protein